MDSKLGYPLQFNGKHSSSLSSSSSSLSSSNTALADSPSTSPVASSALSIAGHAIDSNSEGRHKVKGTPLVYVQKPDKSSGLSESASSFKPNSCNHPGEDCAKDLDKLFCEPEFNSSCKQFVEMSAFNGAVTNADRSDKEGGPIAALNLANHKASANAEQRGNSNGSILAGQESECMSNSSGRIGSPCNKSGDYEKGNPKSASLPFGHHTTGDLEPIQHQVSDDFLPLEPSFSAPPVVLMDLSPLKHVVSEPTTPVPHVEAMTESAEPTSPTGLQRAQTLPSGSLESNGGIGKANKKGDPLRSSTGKGTRTAGAKMSKRKQKKIMKRIATVNPNGTVEFDVNKSARFGPDLFGPDDLDLGDNDFYGLDEEEGRTIPPLQIAILIVGTQGDVQPFVAIGKHLQEYGHRVRLATHSNFREFVLKAGLEFFPLGGDPKVLAGYMVKNKGFLPSGPSEIRTQRKQLKAIINSLLPACIESEDASVAFRAQAIIANPPCYGHSHVAEALKVPLHVFFTMPWTPTSEFPHPLSQVHHSAANRLSYQVVDSLIWWGIRDIINEFRKKKLKLRPITYLSGPQLSASKVPTGYIWSPHLVPKPKDWGPLVDVVGFCFLNMSQDYKPPESLVSWLDAGPPPIYVGFGSLPVEDPEGMTQIIVDALSKTSQRGIINKGWGGIGTLKNPSDSIYSLDNCPHDWLFPRCAAVVHHGGAGTTAAGLRAACPTTIVPFFGDQPFWGERVHVKGVGPPPIPVGQFSLDKLVNAINFMMDPAVKEKAVELAHAMEHENGVVGAVDAFHKHLPREMPKRAQSIQPKTMMDRLTAFKLLQCFGSDLPP